MSDIETEIAEEMGDDETTEETSDVDAPDETEEESENGETEEVEVVEDSALPVRSATPEEIDKAYKAVERSFGNTAKWVDDLKAVSGLKLELCPLCPTQHKGYVDIERAGTVPDEIKNVVMYYLGVARERDYKPDSEVNECPRCDGEGKTDTGSKVGEYKTRKCPHCHGFGFYPPPEVQKANGIAPATFDFSESPTLEISSEPDVDAWGEPKILPDGRVNPNYGKMPQFKVQVEPWGQTAGLTALDAVA